MVPFPYSIVCHRCQMACADQSRGRGGDRPHRNQHSNPAFGDVLNELINFRLDTRQALVLRGWSRRDAAEVSLYVGHVPFTVLVSRLKKRPHKAACSGCGKGPHDKGYLFR